MQRTIRILAGSMAVAGVLVLTSSCEPRKQLVRQPDPQADAVADPVKDDPTFRRPEELQGFFKPNRRAGTLSSEAQEIENDLGVPK
jgi:hypothetical protein